MMKVAAIVSAVAGAAAIISAAYFDHLLQRPGLDYVGFNKCTQGRETFGIIGAVLVFLSLALFGATSWL